MIFPEREIIYTFSRSGGKGGQNINKTETRVQLRWNVFSSKFYSADQKSRIAFFLKNRLTVAGDLIVVSSSERTQSANIRLGKHNMAGILEKALIRPKKRLKTHPTKGSRLKRLEDKRKISIKKNNRKYNDF